MDNFFIFENNTDTISSISIDFDDQNGLNTYAIGNTNIVVRYVTEGLKTITIQLHLSNGNIITTYARLQVINPIVFPIHKAFDDNKDNETITAQIPYLNVYGKAILRYYYQTPNKQLWQPLVIVTGFDPGNKDDFDHAKSRMNYGTGQNLMDELFGLGYDIVIVDFPVYTAGGQSIDGGGDYI